MESKKKKSTGRTAAQIEADHPLIKPENCPGELIKYFKKTREDDRGQIRDLIREELKPATRFFRMTTTNRIWLIGLSAVVIGVVIVLWVHLTQTV
jgi:hypothetical protein